MANTAVDLPRELLNHYSKARTIAYIRELQVPSRFRRQLLQHWSELTGVDVTADDYTQVSAPRVVGEGA